MKLAGIELCHLVRDLQGKIDGYYVNNIYGINRSSLLIKLHHPEKPDIMLMFSTLGIWPSSTRIVQIEENKLQVQLRRTLIRQRFEKIEQIGSERIAYLTFGGYDKKFILIGEFFGDGNIILCNEEMKILALLHSLTTRHRQIRVGAQYVPPPTMGIDVFSLSASSMRDLELSNLTCGRWVGRNLGLPSRYVEHILADAGLDSKANCNTLSYPNVVSIIESSKKTISAVIDGEHDPIIIRDNDVASVYPIKLSGVETSSSVPSFVEGLDMLFTEQILDSGKSLRSKETDKKLTELEAVLERRMEAIETVKAKSNTISKLAMALLELTTTGISSFKDQAVVKVLDAAGAKLVSKKGTPSLFLCEEYIKVNTESSIQSVASHLFDEAKRQSSAISSIEGLLEKTKKKIENLKETSEEDQNLVVATKIGKKSWYERYRWFFTSDGFLVVGGRDSSSNAALIRKRMEQNDAIFHAEVFGSPFYILKDCPDPSHDTIQEVAQATVSFSRAWRESMFGTRAYWVRSDQVKKAAPAGQYLPRGSFYIEGTRNTAKASTLQLAVGIVSQDDETLLVCGPPISIKKASILYAIIEPQGSDIADTAKKIRTEFIKLEENLAKPIPIDEFVRVLPSGQSQVAKVGRGDASATQV